MSDQKSSFEKVDWGKLDSKDVFLFTLKNSKGVEAKITNYGGIITSFFCLDRNGKKVDIVTGFDTLDDYVKKNDPYMGCIVGRCANRIRNASFEIEGKTYELAKNLAPNSIHGGVKGFNSYVWDYVDGGESKKGEVFVTFKFVSPDMDEGFPGKLEVSATYTLNEENELSLGFEAKTDKATVCNLTQHSYFNLNGHGNGSILDHEVKINASEFTPCDKDCCPTGEVKPLKGTPLEFDEFKKIGARINDDNEQLKFGFGYDHNYVIQREKAGECVLAASARSPENGIVLNVYTTLPGVQFYSANHLVKESAKGGKKYEKRTAFCLEPQFYPCAINIPAFESPLLKPDDVYKHTIMYKVSSF